MARPRTPIGSHGEISVVQVTAGSWRARTRYRGDDGRLRQVERFARTKAGARASLQSALTTMQAGAGKDVKRETRLKDLAPAFLASKAGKAPQTVAAYERDLERIIIPRIGEYSVAEATPERLQRFLDRVAADHGKASAKRVRSVLSGMLGLATRSDALRHNPVRELSTIEAKAKGARPVPLDELAELLEKVRADGRLHQLDMVDVVEFIAGTGMRISEVLGLAWENVDLEASTVTVRANVVRVKGAGLLRQDHSKTEAGGRRIQVPAAVVGMLVDRRVSGGPNVHGLVFPTILGNMRDPRNSARDWAEARDRLGLPAYTFHSFRKTVATALDQAGLSARDIAEYLGHADPSLTMSVYMSKTVGGPKAANALDGVLR